jgi:AraC-like DNA-binding protein
LRFLALLAAPLRGEGTIRAVNRVALLVGTPAVLLERFDHEPGVVHADPEWEQARSHAVSIVEGGSFRLRVAGRPWTEVTSKHLFVATPGTEFSCRHDADHPQDRCLSVRFTEQAVESLRGQGALGIDAGVRPLGNRSAYLMARLESLADVTDPAQVEALAGDLYLALAERPGRPARRLFRAHQLSSYAVRVGRVRAMIDAHFAEPLSLSRMAAEAGMSVYHFARVFRELEGRPPHAYLRDRRLDEAEACLRAGASVTETCFAVGFGSLSHFVTTFRRHRGLRPSELANGGA